MPKQISKLLPSIQGADLSDDDASFDIFWDVCPRKTAKKDARKVWDGLDQSKRLKAINGMIYHAEHNPQWREEKKIPHPATFLRGERWDDAIVKPRQAQAHEDAVASGRHSDVVWSAFTQMYGASFLDKFGHRPPPVWDTQLQHLSQDQIAIGLARVRDEACKLYQISLPEFIRLCKLDNRMQEQPALPKGIRDDKIAFEALDEMKKILGVK